MKSIIYVLVFFLFYKAGDVFSQDQLKYLTDNAVEGFTLPLVNCIGSNLNSGWVQRVSTSKISGLDVEAGVIGIGSMFRYNDKNFSSKGKLILSENSIDQLVANLPPGLKEATKNTLMSRKMNVTISGPTIIGSDDETVKVFYKGGNVDVVYNNQTQQVQLGSVTEDTQASGYNLSLMPFAAIQISLGTIYGTKFTGRYTPPMSLKKEFGKMQSYGFGLQHNPMVWFKHQPKFDLSIGCFYQSMSIGDIFDSKSVQIGLFVSKSFGSKWIDVTPFAGLSVESSSTEINYIYQHKDNSGVTRNENISMYSNAENDFRLRAGVSFKFGVFAFNADYNFALNQSVSTGFSIIY
jgi:hypothetical protein